MYAVPGQRFADILQEIGIVLGAAQTDLNLLSNEVSPGQLSEDIKLVKSALTHARLVTRNMRERREDDTSSLDEGRRRG